jgi:hypothetical protein
MRTLNEPLVLDIQLWFDTTVSDVRIGNALNDSAYLNVSGYNLLRTSVTDDGTFEGVAFTVVHKSSTSLTVVKSERGATANLSNAKFIISNLDDILY